MRPSPFASILNHPPVPFGHNPVETGYSARNGRPTTVAVLPTDTAGDSTSIRRCGSPSGLNSSHRQWVIGYSEKMLLPIDIRTSRSPAIAFVSLAEGIDATTPAGKLQMHILGAIAEFERARIVERVRAGLARRVAQGKQLGRPRQTINDLAARSGYRHAQRPLSWRFARRCSSRAGCIKNLSNRPDGLRLKARRFRGGSAITVGCVSGAIQWKFFSESLRFCERAVGQCSTVRSRKRCDRMFSLPDER
jgi:hypothetical protein